MRLRQSGLQSHLCDFGSERVIDRELAQFIYVGEIKRFDPCKSSISASCMQITITGSSTPVRLALGPFLRVPKIGFIYVRPDSEINYMGL